MKLYQWSIFTTNYWDIPIVLQTLLFCNLLKFECYRKTHIVYVIRAKAYWPSSNGTVPLTSIKITVSFDYVLHIQCLLFYEAIKIRSFNPHYGNSNQCRPPRKKKKKAKEYFLKCITGRKHRSASRSSLSALRCDDEQFFQVYMNKNSPHFCLNIFLKFPRKSLLSWFERKLVWFVLTDTEESQLRYSSTLHVRASHRLWIFLAGWCFFKSPVHTMKIYKVLRH